MRFLGTGPSILITLPQITKIVTVFFLVKVSVLSSVLPPCVSSVQHPCQILNLRNLTFLGDMEYMSLVFTSVKIHTEL